MNTFLFSARLNFLVVTRTCLRRGLALMFSLLMANYAFSSDSAAPPSNDREGQWNVDISTFHQFRATWRTDGQSARVTSKMDGAYDVSIIIQLPKAKLIADIDLVHESMILDGGNIILDEVDKQMLSDMNRHLIYHLLNEYEDSQPEHSLLAAQMLGYWSRAPVGYPIGYREVKAQP